jgi:hypothetical protein
MGLVDKLFGKKRTDHPPLDSDSPAAQRLAALGEPLGSLVKEVTEPVEVVMAEEAVYAFVGKPPKKFGVAWIRGDKVGNMKALVEEKNLSPIKVERLVDGLRDAYKRSGDAPRYIADVADDKVVVTLSEDLAREVHEIIDEVAD